MQTAALLPEQILGSEVSEMEGKYLTFWTDRQLFGIPISDVVQIVSIQKITEIPEFPSYAKGIINLRGNMIPVIDVRLRFNKAEIPYDDHTCIVVTSIKDIQVGFLVDEVNEVTFISPELISAPPKLQNRDSSGTYLTGIASQEMGAVLLLDSSKLITDEVLTDFARVL